MVNTYIYLKNIAEIMALDLRKLFLKYFNVIELLREQIKLFVKGIGVYSFIPNCLNPIRVKR